MEALIQQICRQNPGVSRESVEAFVKARLQQHEDREYPTSFSSILTSDACEEEDDCPQSALVKIRCHCGQCVFKHTVAARTPGEVPQAVRCYCSACRRFATSAFAALALGESSPAAVDNWGLGGKVKRWKATCSRLGPVERIMCSNCFTKLAVLKQTTDEEMVVMLALGAIEDNSIPASLAKRWQIVFEDWEAGSSALWWKARPNSDPESLTSRRSRRCTGGCSCGSARFEAALLPGEAQHCYCNLCRRLSGSVAQTWIPAREFRWVKDASLQLVRTTAHGQRHMCDLCGSVLTIVYDSQPDCIWPVAGALDDESLPENAETDWYRVIHICCSMMQPWYRLPDDGLPRLKHAG
eukprot:TRINITY_DN6436_c4_g1_i1.p1 TRINITY_DN6436_c4_g1~~TRINITY_DN6436_c4_g1_i1.p1  ORF type:complete len:353 (-),score=57.92 TRINITY_DN6436_c4_g1_i1:280-1338(-)